MKEEDKDQFKNSITSFQKELDELALSYDKYNGMFDRKPSFDAYVAAFYSRKQFQELEVIGRSIN